MLESSGRYDAKAPHSSATGLYQFTEGTWRGLIGQAPELGLESEGRMDPAQQERAMSYLVSQNAAGLRRHGFEPNLRNVYLCHHFGLSKCLQLLKVGREAPLRNVLRRRAIKANPTWGKECSTVGCLLDWVESKLEAVR